MSNLRRLDDRIFPRESGPRLVKRDLPFSQSRNRLNICFKDNVSTWKLRREDWFHVLLRQNTLFSVYGMISLWTFMILLFASLYMLIDFAYGSSDCGLVDPDSLRRTLNFAGYFAFSLETATTVGYGLPGSTNSFFENCAGIQVGIYFQMVFCMMYNAFLFAFFFARLAKAESRGAQVIFSQTAILARNSEEGDDGPWMLELRVTDADAAHPVVEAHVRLYAKIGGQMVEMRILSPNDILGADLLLSWPSTIQHEVDVYSPLHPPPKGGTSPFRLAHGGLNLRQAESLAGDIEQFACPVCGEHYGDMDRVRRHVKYYAFMERHDKTPIQGSHQELDLRDVVDIEPPTEAEMKAWFPDEIICIVEGIDPLMSGTFQAIQSWTLKEISWSGQFEDCIMFTAKETIVDLEKFHSIVSCTDDIQRTKEDSMETAHDLDSHQSPMLIGRRIPVHRDFSIPLKEQFSREISGSSVRETLRKRANGLE